jgi:hypothetical protein
MRKEEIMRKYLFCMALALVMPVTQAHASHVNFNVGVNVGVPVAPVYVNPPVVIEGPPEFVAPPELGFYVAVGVPYDLFYFSNRYYLCRGNVWYESPYYNGPWLTVGFRDVPYGLRRLPFDRIHYYRDGYNRRYHNAGGREFRGGHEFRHFRPGHHEFGGAGHGGGRAGHGEGGEGHGRWGR